MKTERPTVRRVLGMVIGIVIISLGIAIFKQSHLGNDSITALNIRLSELLGISLGVQNICTNLVFLVVEFIWGRKYIGLGTLVNGLGATPLLELYVMNRKLARLLQEKGIQVHDMDVGTYVTSLEMAGASVTILKLDDELKNYYDMPCRSPYYKKG